MATVRLCILGESFSGKTELVKTYQEITEEKPCKSNLSLGAPNFFHFTPKIQGNAVKLTIWDLPGEERMRTLNSRYFSNIDAFVITLDLTNVRAVSVLEAHLQELSSECHFTNKPVVLACTKADSHGKYVTEDNVKEFMAKHTFISKYFYVSINKSRNSITDLFEYIVRVTQRQMAASKECFSKLAI